MLENKKLLKDFSLALSVPVYYTDGVKYPFKSSEVFKPVAAQFTEFFLRLFDAVEERIAPGEWSRVFDNAQQLFRCIHHVIGGMAALGMAGEEIAQYSLRIAKAILVLQDGHYFSQYGQYLVSTRFSAQREGSFHSKELLFISAALWAYSETLYFVHRQHACQYHGGYDLGDGTFALVRDFCNLRPQGLWREFDFTGIPDTIRVVTVHSRSLEIEFDSYNNLYLRNGDMVRSLAYGYVIVNGRVCAAEDVSRLFMLVQSKLNEFNGMVERYSDREIKHKFVDVFWYRTMPMASFLGVDWRPSPSIHEEADIYFLEEHPPTRKAAQSFAEFAAQYDYSEFI